MDLKTYEQVKFELAELIRSGQLIASQKDKESNKRWEHEQPWRNLLIRLAEDRFTLVVAGRFNRGKSSLMNAVLGMDRLPTGIVPLTSVITNVRYGTSERVLLDYYGSGLRSEAKLEDLPQLVTEKGNPGNVKRIRAAEIQLPAEILRRGFFFVDTPGLGSAIFENSQTTEQFIPEIDVLILVTSYESPLTEDEIRFLQLAKLSVRAVFVVVNKQDTASLAARQEILEYVTKTSQSVLNGGISKPFSVSARDGLAAKQANDLEALRASGILAFEEDLVQFLTSDRSRLFLSAMFDRVSSTLESLPESDSERLGATLKTLRDQMDHQGGSGKQTSGGKIMVAETPRTRARIDSRGVTPCEVCRAVLHQLLDFFRQYQYDLSMRPEIQEEHARKGGFCPQHTWHYEQIASPRGTCTAYPRLLNRVAQILRSMAAQSSAKSAFGVRVLETSCPACTVRWGVEEKSVHSIAQRIQQRAESSDALALCLPHLELLLLQIGDEGMRRRLLLREAAVMERTAEDMQRYAIKHDALRRHLVSQEENDAPLLGLQLLTGHRNVNAIFTVRDIL
jgi:GTP-binding protein EngB required for normal cell division